MGLGLFSVSQGLGRGAAAAAANGVRLAVNVVGGLIAVYWLDLGAIGFFVGIAIGFCAYAALTTVAMLRVKQPSVSPTS
jgi:cytosine/uracil/thiamine/allantoin permease